MRRLFLSVALVTSVAANAQSSGSEPDWGSAPSRLATYANISTGSSGVPLNGDASAVAVGPDGTIYGAATPANYPDDNRAIVSIRQNGSWAPRWTFRNSSTIPRVYCLYPAADGSLIAAGDFTSVDGVAASRIARWDGTQWSPLGSGLNGAVTEVEPGLDGSLYAAGSFTAAGTTAASRVARWDGTAWRALGTGVTGSVYALSVGVGGVLYAAGYFGFTGGAEAYRISRWDGAAWSDVSAGTFVGVYALETGQDGSLYAGGGLQPDR